MKLKKVIIISAASVALLGAGAGAGIFIANNGLADSVTTKTNAKKNKTKDQKKTVNVKIDMTTANETALKAAKNGKVISSELEAKRSTPVYEIKILDGGTEKEYQVNANTGKIEKTTTENISDDNDELALSDLETKLSLADALKKVQEKYSSAKFYQAELEIEDDGTAVYEIKLSNNDQQVKLVLNADDGTISSETTR